MDLERGGGGSIYNPQRIHVYISQKLEIKLSDKVARRHGNQGIISKMLPRQDMPYLTRDPFEQPVVIGNPYILKLTHQVDDKIHGCSRRAKQGGQRVGAIEIWALEGIGVAHIMQEMLTYKSDLIIAR
ncbi:DNA-directed RNA polymerase subunit beta [Bienertia sinuspersici]